MSWSCGNSCSVNVPDGPALTWKDSAAKAVILAARIFGTSKLVPFHERLGKRRGFCERAPFNGDHPRLFAKGHDFSRAATTRPCLPWGLQPLMKASQF